MPQSKIIKDYESSNSNPIQVKRGEVVTPSKKDKDYPGWVWCATQDGKASWVPERILQIKNDNATVTEDYEATELSVKEGDVITTFQSESGWVWCEKENGEQGWVPLENIDT